ncbi:MAG TPA: chemotaxis response regulator protein-glutamate methylesterase [Porticoccaceae bacterium]|nr:chemotaxis response regulator protein-glutamate methylesterase [Porticoccaceae bacterium]
MSVIRVLVVDDSSMYRQLLRELIDEVPGLECIGTAEDGRDALENIRRLEPDAITLDLEMPVMDGLAVIQALKQQESKTRILLVSAHSKAGAALTVEALEAGAYDFITKPQGMGAKRAREEIRRQLKAKLLGVGKVRDTEQKSVEKPTPQFKKPLFKPQALTIGCSTGGPVALLHLFGKIQQPLGIPVFIVQHMPPLFTRTLAESINKVSALTVKEAEHGEWVKPDYAYIAPGGRQLGIVGTPDAATLEVNDREVDNGFKPSVDLLFSSVAKVYRDRVVALILSGMGSDGTQGLRCLKQEGALAIGQEESSCVVYGMPKSARRAGVIEAEMTLDQMAAVTLELLDAVSAAVADL